MLGEGWLLAGFFKFANVASIEVLGGFWFLPGFLKSSISLQLCHVQKANLEVSLALLLNYFIDERQTHIFTRHALQSDAKLVRESHSEIK